MNSKFCFKHVLVDIYHWHFSLGSSCWFNRLNARNRRSYYLANQPVAPVDRKYSRLDGQSKSAGYPCGEGQADLRPLRWLAICACLRESSGVATSAVTVEICARQNDRFTDREVISPFQPDPSHQPTKVSPRGHPGVTKMFPGASARGLRLQFVSLDFWSSLIE